MGMNSPRSYPAIYANKRLRHTKLQVFIYNGYMHSNLDENMTLWDGGLFSLGYYVITSMNEICDSTVFMAIFKTLWWRY